MYILTQGSALLAESETLEEIKAIRDSYPPMVKAWLTIGEKKDGYYQKIRSAEMEGQDGTV